MIKKFFAFIFLCSFLFLADRFWHIWPLGWANYL